MCKESSRQESIWMNMITTYFSQQLAVVKLVGLDHAMIFICSEICIVQS